MQADWQEVGTEAAQPLSRAASAFAPPQRGLSDSSALISHFDDWATVLDNEHESSLSRRGSGKLEGLEPDALRSTVDGLLKRQPGPSKLQPQAPAPVVSLFASGILMHNRCSVLVHFVPLHDTALQTSHVHYCCGEPAISA